MPHFYHPQQDLYLSTNFKVMWSTLKNRPELRKCKTLPLSLRKIQEGLGLGKRRKHYLLVRDPYTRLESFFRDKLRKHVDDSTTWQRSQRIFFPILDLKKNQSPRDIQAALRAMPFEDFVKALPRVYRKDAHLYPQHWVEYLGPVVLGWRISYDDWFKIDSPAHVRALALSLDIDFGPPRNATQDVDEELLWTAEMRSIVQALYAEDFQRYEYPI